MTPDERALSEIAALTGHTLEWLRAQGVHRVLERHRVNVLLTADLAPRAATSWEDEPTPTRTYVDWPRE